MSQAPTEIAIAVPPPPSEYEPLFLESIQTEKTFAQKSRTMEIAAGTIAQLVIAVLQSYTGNIPGLASAFASDLGNMTMNFGSSAVDEESHDAKVIYDPETDYFLMCKLDKVSKKRKGHIPLARYNKTELTVSMYFVKIKAGNDAAREKLQQAANDKTMQLFDIVRNLEAF